MAADEFPARDGLEISNKLVASIEEDRQELIELCLLLGNLTDYAGEERPVAEAVVKWLEDAGIESWIQPNSVSSANAIGVLRGDGTEIARSLILNAHMDTQGFRPSGGYEVERRNRGAWLEGDLLFGQGLANDKAQLAAEMIAVRAVKRVGAKLAGDLYVTGVAQEISAPLESSCREALGANGPKISQIREGFGARWLVDQGIRASFALVAEVTDFTVSVAQAGYMRLRIDVPGVVLYTPAVTRGDSITKNLNPFERAGHVICAVEDWCKSYERDERTEIAGAMIVPKAQIVEIQPSGPAWTESEDNCYLFVDIRLVPGADSERIERSLGRHILSATGLACRLKCYDYHRGHVADDAEQLITALSAAHREVHRTELKGAGSIVQSMWRDGNVFNEAGIKAIGYGPPTQGDISTQYKGSLAGVPRPIAVGDLVKTAQVIGLTSLLVCGQSH